MNFDKLFVLCYGLRVLAFVHKTLIIYNNSFYFCLNNSTLSSVGMFCDVIWIVHNPCTQSHMVCYDEMEDYV